MDELTVKQAALESVAEKRNVTLNIDHYDEGMLKQF
jgi:hypothetical protein